MVSTTESRRSRASSLILAVAFSLLTGAGWCLQFPSAVVDASWLEDHLGAPDLRIVDVRDGITDYWLGHIANYGGGFHEWVADDARPVATGSE